jgi:hypothetical protein
VALKSPDCAKRMIVWSILAVVLVTLFVLGGYALFQLPGQGTPIQHNSPQTATRH